MALFTLSIVSHGHAELIVLLLDDLERLNRSDLRVVLTINVPEDARIDLSKYNFPIKVIENASPKGFGENHNKAFLGGETKYFVPLNPDIRLIDDTFEHFLRKIENRNLSVTAPRVVNAEGELEDSVRPFPMPWTPLIKAFIKLMRVESKVKNEINSSNNNTDWAAGMFLIIPNEIYNKLGGFDEKFKMYYEDVDFCARARMNGFSIDILDEHPVIHNAQRSSHSNIDYTKIHLLSCVKYFVSIPFLYTIYYKMSK